MKDSKCLGQPNANQYSLGCRCEGCVAAWGLRAEKRVTSDKKRRKGSGSASRGGYDMAYAFTKQDIMRARGYE
jgi:hypothetical protein